MSVKTLGLVAVVAALATLSVGSASAALLCTTEPNVVDGSCTTSTYPKNTSLSATLVGGNLKIVTSSGTVECAKSSMSANVSVSGGGGSGVAVVGEVSKWLFGSFSEEANNCSLGGNSCTVSDGLNVPYENRIEHAVGTKGNGYFVLKGPGLGAPGMIVKCGFTIDCIFNSGEIAFELTGGAPATFAQEKELNREGKICPKEVKLKAKYELLPKPMYVSNS